MKPAIGAREQWLTNGAEKLAPRLNAAGFPMPANARYTCGFPSRGGLGKKKRTIGQCWDSTCSADKTFEILISPTQSDPVQVLAILLHEMIHAAVGLQEGHKGNFRKVAKATGLEGKMTATVPGAALIVDLKEIAASLGAYPHATLDGRMHSGPAKQSTRLIKCQCPSCDFTIRTTRTWIDEVGLPTCACGAGSTFQEIV